MVPQEIEVYEAEDMILNVHHFEDRESTYWLQSGAGLVELSEDKLLALRDFVNEYEKENLTSGMKFGASRWPTFRIGTVVLLILILIILPAFMIL